MVEKDILDAEDFEIIDAALESAKLVRENISRAKAAGIDVVDREKRLNDSEARLIATRNAFQRG